LGFKWILEGDLKKEENDELRWVCSASPVHEPTLSHEDNTARNLLKKASRYWLSQAWFRRLRPNELLQIASSAVFQNKPKLILKGQRKGYK
jgi:hypothetical protein